MVIGTIHQYNSETGGVSGNMEMQVVTVTPELARSFLKTNYKGNRKLNKGWVRDLANRMERGEWKLTHQGLLFSNTGSLIDGQHRCHAIIESGVPVQLAVVTGVENEAFKALDQGKNRNLSDLSGLDPKVAQIVNNLATLYSGRKMTVFEQGVFLNGRIGKIASDLVSHCNSARRGLSALPIRAAAVSLVLGGEDKDYVFGCYRSLVLSHYQNMPPIVQQLYRQIINGKVKSQNGTTQKDTFCRAYLAFQKSQANKKLTISEGIKSNIIRQVRLELSKEKGKQND